MKWNHTRQSLGTTEGLFLSVDDIIKVLGIGLHVYLTKELDWKAHCVAVCKKANQRFYNLHRLKPIPTQDELHRIYMYTACIRSSLSMHALYSLDSTKNWMMTSVRIEQFTEVMKRRRETITSHQFTNIQNITTFLSAVHPSLWKLSSPHRPHVLLSFNSERHCKI